MAGWPTMDECSIADSVFSLHDSLWGEVRLGPHIGSGEAADIGASRRPGQSNRPFQARTPARPDWAKPGSEAARSNAGGFRLTTPTRGSSAAGTRPTGQSRR